jgi:class 3 adenylate cyclase
MVDFVARDMGEQAEIQRKLTTILAADVAGFSKLAGADEERTLARLRALRSDLVDPTIALHHGRVANRAGDGAIVEFRSVVDAARCAIQVQSAMADRNARLAQDQRIEFRLGIHVGDVVEEADGDLMGDGVNIAARLEGLCEPGGICISSAAHEQVRDRLKEPFIDLGEKRLKNIARPVRAFGLSASAIAAARTGGLGPTPSPAPTARPWRWRWHTVAAAIAVLAALGYAWYAGHTSSTGASPTSSSAPGSARPMPHMMDMMGAPADAGKLATTPRR